MGTQILIAGLALFLGTFMGLVIAWCFHKRQMRTSKQSREAINAYFQQIESKMTEGFKMLWTAMNPGRDMPSEAKNNIEKASATISSALLEPFYTAGTILAGDIGPEELLGLAGVDYMGK